MIFIYSSEILEIASLICNEDVYKEINHTAVAEYFNIGTILRNKSILSMSGYWSTSNTTNGHYAVTLTEEGICMTYNSINANLIFRNETVDPKFLAEYQLISSTIEPRFWSMGQGYDSNRLELDNYPLRMYDMEKENGYTIFVNTKKDVLTNVDTFCLENPMNIKIALHHPAEVISRDFFVIPFNESGNLLVKPQITKASEGLKYYDSKV